MKKIGILGGIGWPSTVEYYAGICRLAELHRAEAKDEAISLPEISVESLDLAKAIGTIGGDDDDDASWTDFDAYHRNGLRRLQQSGADFAVIASNTAHHRLHRITHGIGMPVLSILDVAARVCARLHVKRVLILGSPQVMRSTIFRETFARHCMEAMAPREAEQRLTAATIRALQRGCVDGASRRIREAIASTGAGRLKGATAVYLGCTELPLAFPAHAHEEVFEADGVRYINSTAAHVRAAFACATGQA